MLGCERGEQQVEGVECVQARRGSVDDVGESCDIGGADGGAQHVEHQHVSANKRNALGHLRQRCRCCRSRRRRALSTGGHSAS